MKEQIADLTLVRDIIRELEVVDSKYQYDFQREHAKNMKLLAEIKLNRLIRDAKYNLYIKENETKSIINVNRTATD